MQLKVETKRLTLKTKWTIARGSSDYKDNVFVTLEHDGITGTGEAAPNTRYKESAGETTKRLNEIRPLIESANPLHYSNLIGKVRQAFEGQSCAKAAFDIALHDWVGKKWGIPLYALWGLDPRNAPLSSYSIGIDEPEKMAALAAANAAMPVFKIKLGSKDDRAIIEAIRRVTDKPIRVDANEGWTDRQQALNEVKWLADRGVEFVEQPMPEAQHEDMVWLKQHSPLPLIADESVHVAADIPRLSEAFDGINIKLMKSEGLLEALGMIRMARAMGLKVMLGCMVESSIAISAAAHLAPLTDYIDLDGALLLADDPARGVENRNGKLFFNEQPGLGAALK